MAVNFAPLTSPRPPQKPIPGKNLEQRRLQEGVANTEFRADLSLASGNEPVARLGTDPNAALISSKPRLAVTVLGGNKDSIEEMAEREGTSRPIQRHDVVMSTDVATADVWNHEFRHRGLDMIAERFNNFEEVQERYGEDGVKAIRGILSIGDIPQESIAELFDDPEGSAGSFGTMADTIQFDLIPDEDKQGITKVLTQMALDVLEEQGSPPPSRARHEQGPPVAPDKEQARGFLMKLLFGE